MASKMRTICPCELNKGFSSKFPEGYYKDIQLKKNITAKMWCV